MHLPSKLGPHARHMHSNHVGLWVTYLPISLRLVNGLLPGPLAASFWHTGRKNSTRTVHRAHHHEAKSQLRLALSNL